MGKLIVNLTTLRTIQATECHPIELRVIGQVQEYNLSTGFLTLKNMSPAPSQPSLKRSRSKLKKSKKRLKSNITESTTLLSLSSTSMDTATSSLTNKEIDSMVLVRRESENTEYIPFINLNLNPLLPSLKLTSTTTTAIHKGAVINVELLFMGLDQEFTVVDLYEVSDPGVVIGRLAELIQFEKVA
ncbi:hypothetical protein CANARDRAFT_23683 [[Candida] arabinofermentans NRRL YB-2248]|uniref:Uncharacterized protein n=1 Tax=[Candida] arabinofermentans NRRL YB-2248 TaxID=983967 RepID=A0A1E4SYZ7_9ASCO|nr:hypothetical protein CANARDRAFT_23683 [[Candida] arabinofermentans NRRL YB-2248]